MLQHLQTTKPTFGGHEKFVFRHGWLKKGFDAVYDDPAVFTRDEALVRLGVGKNMVRSIRFWCLATGMLEEGELVRRTRALSPSALGERLLRDGGWDPYLEDAGSLWLLHWLLVANRERALVWGLTFGSYYEPEFSKAQLGRFIEKELQRQAVVTTEAMIEREVDVCLRSYAAALPRPGRMRSSPGEESLDCPLAELDLLRPDAADGLYRFNIGPKATLPAAVFGFALFAFLGGLELRQRSLAVDEVLYREGSPGQVFKLDENSVAEYLELLEPLLRGRLRLQETAGLRQLYLHDLDPHEFNAAALGLLADYYARHAN